jgi:hypothetical protein
MGATLEIKKRPLMEKNPFVKPVPKGQQGFKF